MPTVDELHNTRALSVGDGAATLRKSYIFQGYTTERSVIDAFGTVVSASDGGTTNVPYIRVRHSQVDSSGWPFLFCYKFDLVKLPGQNDTWRVDYDFRSIQPPPVTANNNSASQGPEEVGFEEMTGRVTGGFDLVYRVGALINDGSGNEGDIGGSPVDVAGQPTSVFRAKYEIQISRTSYQQFSREIGTYGAEVGTRNARPIFGLETGYLLYKGATIQRVSHNSYRVTHAWQYDSMAHLIQAPKYTADGGLALDTNGNCKTVYAIQPFPLGNSAIFV